MTLPEGEIRAVRPLEMSLTRYLNPAAVHASAICLVTGTTGTFCSGRADP